MKKNNLKKLIYMLSLSSTLSLNSCGNTHDDVKQSVTIIEEQTEDEVSNNTCLENHINESLLKIQKLDNGKKYITDADVKLAVRDKFLTNNMIANENIIDNNRINEILDNTKYMYLFDNNIIRFNIQNYVNSFENYYERKLTNEEILSLMNYKEDNTSKYLNFSLGYKKLDNSIYKFNLNSFLASSEQISESMSTNEIVYEKSFCISKCNYNNEDYYDIDNNYTFANNEVLNSSKISVVLKENYELKINNLINNDFKCTDYEGTLELNNAEDKIEIMLTEEQFKKINDLLVMYSSDNKKVEHLLNDNNKLLNDLYGDSYSEFIEKNQKVLKYKK